MNIFLHYFLAATILFANTSYAAATFSLQTTAFQNKTTIPTLYTCDGKNISPPLSWLDTPAKTKTFAIIMSDPDAPNGTFYHWIVFNIPTTVSSLTEATALPAGAVIAKNNLDKYDYSGPCPPKGKAHNYIVTLYALDNKISVSHDADPETILTAMKSHILGQAEITTNYSRQG